jgi:hypothetical protein
MRLADVGLANAKAGRKTTPLIEELVDIKLSDKWR